MSRALLGSSLAGRRAHRAQVVRGTLAGACALLEVAGCSGTPIASERAARADLEAVASLYRPGDARPQLPSLTPTSPLADFVRYAMLNSPRVETMYYAWAASVERVTTARSLPDPRLTFEADIGSMLDALMPGLMVDLPGPGVLRATGDAAAAEARVGYFAFELEVLRAAYETKSAYYRLHFLDESLRVRREAAALLADVESQAERQVGAGRGTIQDVLRAQIERVQVATQIANLEDSRVVLEAELRAALGHRADDATVPVPTVFESGGDPLPADEILAVAMARNPELRQMEAEVRRAEAMLDVAHTSRVPEFSLGIEADVRASPVMWRPAASMSLPIWRDKIAAEIAAAQAERQSAEARLTAEQIALGAELASMLYMYRESSRNAELFGQELAPRARQALEASRSGYASGRSSFLDVIDAERQVLEFELSLVQARTQRELALASLSLVIAGAAPDGSPVLGTRGELESGNGEATGQESHP